MLPEDIAKQSLVEREMLTYIEQALRVALDWDASEGDFARNLSTLRFVTQSFQRHLNRAWALQQHGGYLLSVLEKKPHLERAVTEMQQNHNRLEAELDTITVALERVSSSDLTTFDRLRKQLIAFLDALKQHNANEVQLYQDAFMLVEGGEA